jgi:hypothetical protein
MVVGVNLSPTLQGSIALKNYQVHMIESFLFMIDDAKDSLKPVSAINVEFA